MDCDRFDEELDEYRGQMSADRRAAAEAHLAVCPRCRELADLMGRLLEAAPTEPPPLSADFADRVMTQVMSQVHRDAAAGMVPGPIPAPRLPAPRLPALRPARPRVLRFWAWGPAAAAAAAIGAVFLPGLWGPAGTPQTPDLPVAVAPHPAVEPGTPATRDPVTPDPVTPEPVTPVPEPVPPPGGLPDPTPAVALAEKVGGDLIKTLGTVAPAAPDPAPLLEAVGKAAAPAPAAAGGDALGVVGRDGLDMMKAGYGLTRDTAGGMFAFVLRAGRQFDPSAPPSVD
jgi:hypothetical protein